MGEVCVIKNIRVIDPEKKTCVKRDVHISDGVYISKSSYAERAKREAYVVDVEGCYLAPGFTDMHVHVFEGRTALGIEADKIGIRQGVLTVVDAGSSGIRDFDFFKSEVIDKSITDVKFFLNIARQGLCDGLSELAGLKELMTLDELLNFRKIHGKGLVGLKVRMSGSVVRDTGVNALVHARELADKTGLPIMVHIGNAPPKLGDVLELLKKGDIVTHFSHGKKGGIRDYKEEYIKAAEKGVHFDLGHGTSSFSFETLSEIMAVRPVDYSISTDIYRSNYEKPVGSLMLTMTKILSSGVTLEEAVYKVTSLPAGVLGINERRIEEGFSADATMFRLEPAGEDEVISDSEGFEIKPEKILRPVMTIESGKKVWGYNV